MSRGSSAARRLAGSWVLLFVKNDSYVLDSPRHPSLDEALMITDEMLLIEALNSYFSN